ncbi:major facilitator superfamily domain-containing protein [Fennellomyces sp. T-0311]|nr:major facilitator superfamily domain-containing protein [Fennellomyces sp. T-0311]
MAFKFFINENSDSSHEKKGNAINDDDVETPQESDSGFVELDSKELRWLMWKLDLRIIPYVAVLFEVPANLMLKLLGPRVWISTIMLVWGGIMAAMVACRTGTQLVVARFFLGVAESGLYPGVSFYLSIWYTKKQQATRIALFYGSSTLAGAFGGILAYGIMHMVGLQ